MLRRSCLRQQHAVLTECPLSPKPTRERLRPRPLVMDITTTMVSRVQGASPVGARRPPHRSTTFSPRQNAATAAPISARSAKLRSNSTRTSSKPGATRKDQAASTTGVRPNLRASAHPINAPGMTRRTATAVGHDDPALQNSRIRPKPKKAWATAKPLIVSDES